MRVNKVYGRYRVQVTAGTFGKSAQIANFVSANGALAYITDLVQSDQRRVQIQSPQGPITFDELKQRADEEIQDAKRARADHQIKIEGAPA